MPYQSLTRLNTLVAKALEDPEITNGLAEADIKEKQIGEILHQDQDELWTVIISEVNEIDRLEETIKVDLEASGGLLESIDLPDEFQSDMAGWLAFVMFIASVIFVLSPWIDIPYLRVFASTVMYDYVKYPFLKFLIAFATVIGLTTISFQIVTLATRFYQKRSVKNKTKARENWRSHNRQFAESYDTKVERLSNLTSVADLNMIEKSIKERIRVEINERISPSYGDLPENLQTSGLAELVNPSRTVLTSAREKLDFLLRTMPGGSIGIAGPRGSGKSTLIRTYCGPERVVPTLNDRQILPVLTSAPVRYEFRDFLLHLFASACEGVLTIEKVSKDFQIYAPALESRVLPKAVLNQILLTIRIFSFYCGIVLVAAGPLLWQVSLQFNQQEKESLAIINEKTKRADPTVDTLVRNSNTTTSIKAANSNVVKSNEIGFEHYYFASISDSTTLPAKIFSWGLISLALFFISILSLGPVTFATFLRPFYLTRQILGRRQRQEERPKESKHVSSAREFLRKIKFQQSYTSGWSGGIKLSSFYEGQVQHEATLAERTLSNPEIVSEFASFLRSLSVDYHVIIGIDELDKMESEVDAKNFLNELKSIFGLERCFFLITVSENAMHNFERRGIPFRDVFDSSFDNIVHVDYLDLESSTSLLQRRVIGRPIPFFYLAHCLAAGLPRDTIRVFREIIRHGQKDRRMVGVCSMLVVDDIDAKLKAMRISAKGLPDSFQKRKALLELLEISRLDLTISGIHNLMLKIKLLVDESEGAPNPGALINETSPVFLMIASEILAYLGYISTVWEVFSLGSDKASLYSSDRQKSVERLAQARQGLAIDFAIANKITNEVRLVEGVPILLM